jgi:HEAT repeat protein
MLSCPTCDAEVSGPDRCCPGCGRSTADAPAWNVVFKSPKVLKSHFDEQLIHHSLALPHAKPVAPDTRVPLKLVLPDDGGDLWLTGKVVETLERPSRANAPYDIRFALCDLDDEKMEILRRGAGGAAPVQECPAPPGPADAGADTDVDAGDIDRMVYALIQPRVVPSDPVASENASAPEEPEPIRERLPEELAKELSDFTLEFVRAVTKSSYYTADHQEAGKAKLGLYNAFTALVGDRSEVTFYARKAGEKSSILVYGIFEEPTDLAQAMIKDTSAIYIPKLSHYFEANDLLSISFKRALTESEFHQFVDLLAGPTGATPGAAGGIGHRLAENRIHNISVVVVEDRVSDRGLSWRVEMALTRLKKDLSVIPLYEHLEADELRRVRLQVFRDVVRPLRRVDLIRELLENCDHVVEAVEEFSEDQLAEIETQVLASVPDRSLPELLEGLVNDIAEAKRESETELERLLRLTRRVAKQLSPEQATNLEDAFRVLVGEKVLALEELPSFLQRKFTFERDANSFVKFQDRIFARFDREGNEVKYLFFLDFFESIFGELLSRADPSATIAIVKRVASHRTSEPPFESRPMHAATWLERIIYSSLADDIVRELSQADKLKRESLLELCGALGDETVPTLFKALHRCDNASTRHAIAEVLGKLDYAARALVRSELEQPDLPVDYLIELLHVLSSVGGSDCASLVARALDHADPQVRIEALATAAGIDAAVGEECALAALADEDPKVREVAIKSLFDAASTAPAFFDFCGRVLSGSDESEAMDEPMARVICFRLAAYEQEEAREQRIGLLRLALGDAAKGGGRWWSSLKRAVTGDPEHLSVVVAACQALGHLGAEEASGALENVSRQANPTLKRAAEQALERIRNG